MEGLGGLVQQFAAILIYWRHGIEDMLGVSPSLILCLIGLEFHLELRMDVEDAADDILQVVLVLGIDIE